jgi:hypothetical protein
VVADGNGRHHDLAAPGRDATKPGSATTPFPGVAAALLDVHGNELQTGGGLLALTKPWPSMLRTIWGDDQRYVDTYFTKWAGRPDLYFPGDGVKRDADGFYWIWGAWTTCSTCPATASAPWRWRARSWIIRPWPKPPWWARRTR